MAPASPGEDLAVDIIAGPRELWRFFTLVRGGFLVRTAVPCPLQDLLCQRLEIPADYVAERVQTVFLNGRAVDDLSTAVVDDGAVVALSAAMPGLVGATLRKGGTLTSLRSSLSLRPSATGPTPTRPGGVTVKFFNLICADLGPGFLARGLVLPADTLGRFLNDMAAERFADGLGLRSRERPISLPALSEAVARAETVRLSVRTAKD
jgi:hypothetical protein